MSLNTIDLSLEEQIKTGCSHALRMTLADIKAAAAAAGSTTSLTISVKPYVARDIMALAFIDLVTPFAGTSITNLVLDFGYNGASVDDDDAFIDNIELAGASTEILADAGSVLAVDTSTVDNTYGQQENDVITSLRNRVNDLRARRFWAAQEAGALEVKLTSTGANLSALTAGEVVLYFKHIRPTDLRGING